MLKFLRKNWILIILISAIIAGGFLRLYKINLFVFADDQARDFMEITKLVKDHKIIWQGPEFSVDTGSHRGHLGPFYFYFVTPVYLIFNGSPLGNVLLVAILNISAIYLIFLVGRNYFNEKVGLISALILSFSPLVLNFSRFAWNPNIMIFFVLLMLLTLKKIIDGEEKYYLVLSFLIAIITQIQASAFILIPTILILMILKIVKFPCWKKILLSAVIFILMYSSLIIYDIFHHFYNLQAYISILLGHSTTPGGYHPESIFPFWNSFVSYSSQLTGATFTNQAVPVIILMLVFISLTYNLIKKNKTTRIIAIFAGIGLIFLAKFAYGNPLENYFFLSVTTFIILLLADFLYCLSRFRKIMIVLITVLLILFIYHNSLLFFKDISTKAQRNFVALYASDTLWPDMQASVDYIGEYLRENNLGSNQTFEINFSPTCPPSAFVNRDAFLYIMKQKNIIPSNASGHDTIIYIVQPPQSIDCAQIDRKTFNIVNQKQFGTVVILIGKK